MVAINFPDSPTNGQEHSGYVWDATNNVWNRLPTLPALDLVNFSAVAPSNPQDGQFWFDTTAGKMYVYYNDGSSAQWVSTLGGLVGQTGEEGQILVHNGTEWLPSDGISHNAIINGDFGVWQRGTSFTTTATSYSADRFSVLAGGATNATVSRQSFTPADIEVVGYGDAEYYARVTSNGSISGTFNFVQKIEDVRSFAGQTVTLSFWGKASSATTVKTGYRQNFGSGGSSTVTNLKDVTFSTSWQRFTRTVNLNSLAGKTVGSNSYLQFEIINAFNVGTAIDGVDFDIWGVQLEAGSVATPFRLAGGGSKAAELALCQRYYFRLTGEVDITPFGVGLVNSTSRGNVVISYPVKMRSAPSFGTPDVSNLSIRNSGLGAETLSAIGLNPVRNSTRAAQLDCNTVGSNLVAGHATILDGNTDAILNFDAEL